MRCKPGILAYIVRPWAGDEIGTPVTVIRRSFAPEDGVTRGGMLLRNDRPDTVAWLCDASGPGFPLFIADACLLPISGLDVADTAVPVGVTA